MSRTAVVIVVTRKITMGSRVGDRQMGGQLSYLKWGGSGWGCSSAERLLVEHAGGLVHSTKETRLVAHTCKSGTGEGCRQEDRESRGILGYHSESQGTYT